MEPSSHPVVWVFGQFNLCGQAGSWEKAGCEAGQEGPQGGMEGGNELWKGPRGASGGPTPLSCNQGWTQRHGCDTIGAGGDFRVGR